MISSSRFSVIGVNTSRPRSSLQVARAPFQAPVAAVVPLGITTWPLELTTVR